MIIDSIERWESYKALLPDFEPAMRFALTLTEAQPGRYDCTTVPQGRVYVLVQEGQTLPPEEGQVEAHRLYADVQIMLEGGETVYYADIAGLKETVPYREDIAFYANAGQPIAISKGMFYVALPQDGHIPCRHLNGIPGTYRKLVLKIRL